MPVDCDAVNAVRSWALELVCPYWIEHALSPEGGFYESLDASGQADRSGARSVLNQARLTYVFSHAALLSQDQRMRSAAEHGFAYLRQCHAKSMPFVGWHRVTHVDGGVLDAVCDTYDQAFVIFAMAYYYRLSKAPEALQLAEQTWQQLETALADRENGGFQEEQPFNAALPRRQNPHMHLLEAALAMHETLGGGLWLARAQGLVALFKTRFFDASSGSLAEYFDARWHAAQGDFGALRNIGQLREPGHQFEWVWLLHQYAQHDAGADVDAYIDALFDFGTRYGMARDGLLKGCVMDFVSADGSVIADSCLMWPQTEYIKACVSQFERSGDVQWRERALAHLALTQKNFMYAGSGNWRNQINRAGEAMVSATPSRVLYHVFLAAAELLRICERK